jgi:syntaxin 1B/2/3
MNCLNNLINQLDQINQSLLCSIDEKDLDGQRIACISNINKQCQIIKQTKHNKDEFIELIKKYITIQENYKYQQHKQLSLQLLMRYPHLSQHNIDDIINNNIDKESILCLFKQPLDAQYCYHYVQDRHQSILKLERDIQELNELFIASYALVNEQEIKIDHVTQHIDTAKNYCHGAKEELVEAYKVKRTRCCLF